MGGSLLQQKVQQLAPQYNFGRKQNSCTVTYNQELGGLLAHALRPLGTQR